MEITLKMSEEQATVVIAALDAYARAMMGQLDWIANLVMMNKRFQSSSAIPLLMQLRDGIDRIEPLITGMSNHAYHSISSLEIGNSARVAYDIQQVLRHDISWAKSPDGGHGVWFNEPMQTAKEQMAVVTVAGEGIGG